MNDVSRCPRCLLPETVPGLDFDDEGLCDICRQTPPVEELAAVRAGLRREMDEVLARHRDVRPVACVVAFSGGKDSSYTLLRLIEDHGLACLAITIDNGFLSSGTLDNCRAICGALGVDHVLFTPHRGFMERMYRASAEDEGVHPPAAVQRASAICTSCINLINTHMIQRALEIGAPLIAGGYIGGQLPRDASTVTLRPGLQARLRTSMVNRFVRHFGEEARPYFEVPDRGRTPEVTIVNPMLGLDVGEDEILAALEPLGWRRPVDTGVTSTNCRLNDLGVYMHTRRHGFHPYAFEIADQLRHGLTTRPEALRKLETLPAAEDVAWLAQRIGVRPDGP